MPDDWYADVVALLAPFACRVAVDTSDAPLTALAASFGRGAPDLIKPNAEELAGLTGASAEDLETAAAQGDPEPVVSAAHRLLDQGARAVLATLGAAGAVLVDETGSWMATPPPIVPRSTVGAGDASLAGYVRADVGGAEPPQRLRMAVAYGSAAAALPGSALPSPAQIDLECRSRSPRFRPPCPVPPVPNPTSTHDQLTMTQPIINTDLVLLDVDAGADKEAVIGRLVNRLADAGRTTDSEGLIAAAMAREAQSATGLPGGIAIPHCRSPYVDTASIGFARLKPAVDFGAPDGPADLAFLIAAPESGGAEHMKLLSSLARALVRKDFVESLRNASTPDEVVGLVDGVVNPAPAAAAGCEARGRRRPRSPPKRPKPSSPRRWSRSPPARPASRTPTWRPTRWSPRPRRPAPPCMWRPRDRRAARRCRPRRSPAPMPSSSPPTSA